MLLKQFCLITTLLTLLFPTITRAQGTTQLPQTENVGKASCLNIADIRPIFKKIALNRHIYNQYNDSIFLIHDRKHWTSFFQRRSAKNHEIYNENNILADSVMNYFNQGSPTVPDEAYDSLYICTSEIIREAVGDPAILHTLTDYLIRHYQNRPDRNAAYLNSLLWKADAYYQTWNMTNDTKTMQKAYDLMKYVADSTHVLLPEGNIPRANALSNLSITNWCRNGLQSLADTREAKKQLQELLANPLMKKLDIRKATISTWKHQLDLQDTYIVRNLYLADHTDISKAEGDSLARSVLKKAEAQKNIETNTQMQICLIKVKLGELSFKQALDACMKIYIHQVRPRIDKSRFEDIEVFRIMQHYYNLTYVNDMADISEAEKRKNTLLFCRDIIRIFRHRVDKQDSNYFIKIFSTLSTYPRILKHLNPSERIDFVQELNVATQVTTYAHSVHVAKLAEALIDGIIEFQPKLLIGTLDIKSVKEAREYHKEIKRFIYQAALYHDVGKNSIISVVNNDYRPLSNEERTIIRMHPEMGLKFLAIDESLAPYHDIVLGHHKWYNGKGGYPEDFDNTRSPKRILIDIVTLCDCMQAATERLGRNYKTEKSFESLMQELREGAGTRYNPHLVSLIDHHPQLYKKLDKIAIKGWLNIYYDIYKQYFSK